MAQVFLSDIELYYSTKISKQDSLSIEGEETKHISKVMRHNLGDTIFVTDGMGKIYESKIEQISINSIDCSILKEYRYENKLRNFTVCIPRLKSQNRFEFALEKCVELGYTNFIIFETSRTLSRGAKIERWQKVTLAAMKQSIRSFLPTIKFEKDLKNLEDKKSQMVIFDQAAEDAVSDYKFEIEKKYKLLFGPEGGLSEEELKLFNDKVLLRLTGNRLRAETAIITACSSIALNS